MPETVGGVIAYSLGDIMAMSNDPQPTIIEKIIYRSGKTLLVGKPKAGKSYLSIRIGIAVSFGEPALGLTTAQCKVLYLEFDRRFLVNTFHELTTKANSDFRLVQLRGVALNTASGKQQVMDILKDFAASGITFDLLIIDHKTACVAGKESDDDATRDWVQAVDDIIATYPMAVLVVVQPPKGYRADIVDSAFGSRVLSAWADTVLRLERDGGNKEFRKLEGVSNYGDIDAIRYNKKFEIAADKVEEKTLQQKAADAIRQLPWPMQQTKATVESIARTIQCSVGTAWNAYREVKLEKTTGQAPTNTPSP